MQQKCITDIQIGFKKLLFYLFLIQLMFYSCFMTVGERIKKIRKDLGFTQQQLADKVGITYIQIGRYETGKSNASSEILRKISEATNTTTDFLMSGGNAEQLNDKELLLLFKEVELMDNEDKNTIKQLIDAFVTKRKLRSLAK